MKFYSYLIEKNKNNIYPATWKKYHCEEYMNNEQIMNIGNMYYAMNDPDNFCKVLVKKATELWEKNTTTIDDITLIVIFFTFL